MTVLELPVVLEFCSFFVREGMVAILPRLGEVFIVVLIFFSHERCCCCEENGRGLVLRLRRGDKDDDDDSLPGEEDEEEKVCNTLRVLQGDKDVVLEEDELLLGR
jgi:hypothetical protein